MYRPVHRWLLCLLAVALAAAPLRGLLAMPVASATGGMSHCAHMQHAAMQRHAPPMQGGGSQMPCPGCKQGCGGGHCHHLCPGCSPVVFTAINHPIGLATFDRLRIRPLPFADRYSDRTAPPPYRPPIIRS
jgi:hypothetical protein